MFIANAKNDIVHFQGKNCDFFQSPGRSHGLSLTNSLKYVFFRKKKQFMGVSMHRAVIFDGNIEEMWVHHVSHSHYNNNNSSEYNLFGCSTPIHYTVYPASECVTAHFK